MIVHSIHHTKYTYHKRLYHNAGNTLKTHNEYSFWTLLGGGTTAIANGVLCLHTEEETGCETVNVRDARCPRFIFTLKQRVQRK